MPTTHKRRQALIGFSVVTSTLALLVLVAASPFALRVLSADRKFDWQKLSSVGQTYGAVSALLVVIGLSGVSITIILQLRESRRARREAGRTHHFELVRLALEDPYLTEVSASVGGLTSVAERRQTIYINLQLQYWLMLWEFNDLRESTLRGYLADLFQSPAGRKYWQVFGETRTSLKTRAHAERHFLEIVSDEYSRVQRQDDGVRVHRRPNNRGNKFRMVSTVLTSVAVGLLLAVRLRRKV